MSGVFRNRPIFMGWQVDPDVSGFSAAFHVGDELYEMTVTAPHNGRVGEGAYSFDLLAPDGATVLEHGTADSEASAKAAVERRARARFIFA